MNKFLITALNGKYCYPFTEWLVLLPTWYRILRHQDTNHHTSLTHIAHTHTPLTHTHRSHRSHFTPFIHTPLTHTHRLYFTSLTSLTHTAYTILNITKWYIRSIKSIEPGITSICESIRAPTHIKTFSRLTTYCPGTPPLSVIMSYYCQ